MQSNVDFLNTCKRIKIASSISIPNFLFFKVNKFVFINLIILKFLIIQP